MDDASGPGAPQRVTRRTAALGALALAAGAGTAAAGPTPAGGQQETAARVRAILPDLQAYVRQGMADWHVPGAALGVVVGDAVLLAAGYGVRDSQGAAPVDERTLFQIGSTTKAFCAATEAILVDQGRMAWSDRVIDHDPEFRLQDPWVTREFRIFDLLAQRSGLRAYVLDLMWALGFGPDARVAALRYVDPVSSFRTTFAYQNILHLVAGRIVARHAGAADWPEALHRLILEPLGMADTNTSAAALQAAANHASGHVWFDGRMWRPPIMPNFEDVGPAGAMNSTVRDLIPWLRLQLARGSIDGRRVISAANLTETWRPRVTIDEPPGKPPEFPTVWSSYGSGWILRVTDGGSSVWHNGGTGLFRTHIGFLPDHGVGFVMLTNEGNNDLVDATGLWFYDRVLGNPDRDYSAEILVQARERTEKAVAARRRPPSAASAAPLAAYAGAYHSELLQDVTVAPDGEALRLDFAAINRSWRLVPWNGDTFLLQPADAAYADAFATGEPQFARFSRDPSGEADTLRFDGSPEFRLRRKS
jgi:CubicO group peptidase (beta-lactamase class C family)